MTPTGTLDQRPTAWKFIYTVPLTGKAGGEIAETVTTALPPTSRDLWDRIARSPLPWPSGKARSRSRSIWAHNQTYLLTTARTFRGAGGYHNSR